MEREAKGLLDRNRFVCVKGLGVQRNSPFFQFLIGSKKDLLAAVKYTNTPWTLHVLFYFSLSCAIHIKIKIKVFDHEKLIID